MTHTALMEEMRRLGLNEAQTLNLLGEARLISDNCVRVWDIAEPDRGRCVQWLKARRVESGEQR